MTTETPQIMACVTDGYTYVPREPTFTKDTLKWDPLPPYTTISGNSIGLEAGLGYDAAKQGAALQSSGFLNLNQQPKKEIKPMPEDVNCRIVRIFIVDVDENLPLNKRILHQTEEQLTDLTDTELFMTLGIGDKLAAHNTVRAATLDKKASTKAGKDVFLEPIRIRDLRMFVSAIASF